MAYVVSAPTDENQQQSPGGQGPTSPTNGGTVQTGPSSGVGSAAGPSAGAPGAAPKGAGGEFASLNQYVGANQGTAAPLTNNITGQLNNQYQTLQGNNQQTLQGAQNSVNSGYTTQNNALIAQEAANPVSFASNPGNIQSFQAQLNDQYTGPTSAESTQGFQNQQAADQSAATTAQNAVNTEAGQQGLIQQTENVNAPSTTGLNEAILYSTPGALNQIQTAGNQFGNLTNQLTQGAAPIDQNITQAQQSAQAASQDANNAIQGQLSGLNTNIANENTAAYNTANTQYQNLLSQLNQFSTSPQIQALQAAANANPSGANIAALNAAVNAQFSPSGPISHLAQPANSDSLNLSSLIPLEQQIEESQFVASPWQGNVSAWTQAQAAPGLTQFLTGAAPTQSQFDTASTSDLATGNALNELAGQNIFTAPTNTTPYTAPSFNEAAAQAALQGDVAAQQQAALSQADSVAQAQQNQHQASLHSGFFGGLQQDITHPGDLLATIGNPLASSQNTENLIEGKQVDPYATSLPGAKYVAPVLGGIVGGIYGGPSGALAGSAAGQELGTPLQNSPDLNKIAFGGIITHLDKNMKKAEK